MEPTIPVKKLFRLALYTSPVIAVLVIGAVSIVPYFILKGFDFILLGFALSIGSAVIFTFWSLNIGLTFLLSKPRSKPVSRPLRYFLSYGLISSFVLCVRLGALHFVDEKAFLKIDTPDYTIYFTYVMRVSIVFSTNTIILILQDLILIRENKVVVEMENARLRIKNVEALNQQLNQQIHPHFLFNSLNTLKSLIKLNPEDAERYLMQLSDYLRVSISKGQSNTVSLAEELKLCANYLGMQKMRFGEALLHEVNVPEEIRQTAHVPAFSLQVLIENAIKHNAFTVESPLHIHIGHVDGWLEVRNNLQRKQTTETSLGFGLANLSERYRLLSGSEPRIQANASEFSVTIKVLKDANSHH
jgi:hypothetical protein